MALTPGESDRLLLFLEAQLALRRRERGLRLNVPEAQALIADAVCEWARDGRGLIEARDLARDLLTFDDVLEEVPAVLTEVRVEARFDDGTRLVVVKDPFRAAEAGSAGPASPVTSEQVEVVDGLLDVRVTNEAPTAIGLTSHIHLAEVNPRLRLDRAAAFGRRPAIDTGQTVWIRPGESVILPSRPIEGARIVVGNSGTVDGPLDDPAVRSRALETLRACGYLDEVDGQPVNDPAGAERAVAEVMARRAEAGR